MSEEELVEQLAEREHARWARWQAYLHSQCERDVEGALVIPSGYVEALERQIAAPYADLSEGEKDSDRKEVVEDMLPLIRVYVQQAVADEVLAGLQGLRVGGPVVGEKRKKEEGDTRAQEG